MSELAEYPFAPQTFRTGQGHRLTYIDEGRGPALVMVHGNPSWSYLYRNVVKALRSSYRCIVPDHLGCGLSDKPQSANYSLGHHIDNLEALLDYLNIQHCVVVVHDWGGAIGMGWAIRHPERVLGSVVLNTAAFPSQRLPWRIAVCRWPYLGALLVRGFNVFAWAATFMAVRQKMAPEVAAGFLAPYSSWAKRVAVHRFVQDIPMHPGHPSWAALTDIDYALHRLKEKPMLICWGGQDFCFNRKFYDEWLHRFPQAQGHYFPQAGHYVLEDALPEILQLLPPFLQHVWGQQGK